MRGEAAEADVVKGRFFSVGERVSIHRGVRGGQLAGASLWHGFNGSGQLVPELEHLPLRLEREANLAPGVHLAVPAPDLEHTVILAGTPSLSSLHL